MDISSLHNVSSGIIKNNLETKRIAQNTESDTKNNDVFASFMDSALKNINQTNAYISDAEDEEVKLAMGETDNTHDLTIALQKASSAIQYTVAVRDKFLEAYKTIMNIQI